MALVKLRLEAELDRGDRVTSQTAVADALEAAAKKLRGNLLEVPNDVIDVPRGKIAYMFDTRGARAQEPDDGN
jgi:hypothetical protein